jgi:hypothetical protein
VVGDKGPTLIVITRRDGIEIDGRRRTNARSARKSRFRSQTAGTICAALCCLFDAMRRDVECLHFSGDRYKGYSVTM